ncbi:G5 domain protein [Parvimonas sp. oral taxon 110 str. F0139]|nr:G5 domain protein [Parvimonas sp. oral taxon 110 str. F0139]
MDGKVGLKVESEKILDNFNTVPVKFDLEIPTIVTEYKKIDKTLLSSIKGVIGEATTKFDNQPNRNNNIKIAANKINEFVVNPGETFSFSKELGEVSKNTGYKPAGTFINSKIVDSIGGGICQVSSTLYQALVKSDLKIVERNQHSMRVPYCTIGLDAMYYEGSSDLKFQNTFDFPIVITSYVSNGEITFRILGDTDKKNYDIKLFTTDVSRIPMPIEEVPDPSLPEGKKVVVEKGFPGYRGSSYKQKGNEKAELLNSDYYKPKKQIVKVGTKKEVKETIEKEKND